MLISSLVVAVQVFDTPPASGPDTAEQIAARVQRPRVTGLSHIDRIVAVTAWRWGQSCANRSPPVFPVYEPIIRPKYGLALRSAAPSSLT